MAELTISGRMIVKTVKAQFHQTFGLTLRVYKGVSFADDAATIASIRHPYHFKMGAAEREQMEQLKIHGNMKIGTLEEQMKTFYGIRVQVANAENTKLLDNNLTISEASKQK